MARPNRRWLRVLVLVGLLTGLISITSAVAANDVPVCPADAAVDLEVTVNGADADAPPGPEIPIGDPLTWTYHVTNSGLVPLRGIIVGDDALGIVCKFAELAPGATALCEKAGEAGEGQHAVRAKAGATCMAANGRKNTFKDIDWAHYLGVQEGPPDDGMVLVPAGEFQMGCDPAHNGGHSCQPDELPLHTVYLDAYRIDRTEVTNADYALCVTAGSCTPPASGSSATRTSYYGDSAYTDYPVLVSWDQAYAFCAWRGGRLPSEAEWEKAARGAYDTRAYPWGDDSPNCALANFDQGPYEHCVGDTSEVGSYPAGASPYGALDMAGNVYEWVNDWFSGDYYGISSPTNPPGPALGERKGLRGGGTGSDPYYLLVASRTSGYPEIQYYNVGLRCAADAP